MKIDFNLHFNFEHKIEKVLYHSYSQRILIYLMHFQRQKAITCDYLVEKLFVSFVLSANEQNGTI